MWLTCLPGHGGKVIVYKKIVSISRRRCKGRKRDCFSLFSVILETKSEFPIVFLRLVFGKFGLTELADRNGKVTSDKKMIFISYQRNKEGNRDYCSHFSMIFETTSKFPIVFFKIDIWKSRSWRSYRATARNWRQIWIWLDDNFKGSRGQIEILAAIFDWISKKQLNFLLFL